MKTTRRTAYRSLALFGLAVVGWQPVSSACARQAMLDLVPGSSPRQVSGIPSSGSPRRGPSSSPTTRRAGICVSRPGTRRRRSRPHSISPRPTGPIRRSTGPPLLRSSRMPPRPGSRPLWSTATTSNRRTDGSARRIAAAWSFCRDASSSRWSTSSELRQSLGPPRRVVHMKLPLDFNSRLCDHGAARCPLSHWYQGSIPVRRVPGACFQRRRP